VRDQRLVSTGHAAQVLLILHFLDYRGSYRDLRVLQSAASTTVPVPWVASKVQTP
jgi:hypothetical protein